MSFILDALKKSESDRQRQSGPALFEVKVAPPRTRLPLWAIAVAALLVVNLGIVMWMALRHPGTATPAAALAAPGSAAPATAPTGSAPAAAPSVATQPANAAASRVPPTAAPTATPAAAAPAAAPAAASTTGAGTLAGGAAANSAGSGPNAHGTSNGDSNPDDYAPAAEPPAAAAGSSSGGHVRRGTAAGVPLYQDAAGTAGAQIPQLRLDLHVYAMRPQDRFVMINMHKLREGDSLPEGVHVESILPEGVVLSYNGSRFLLPRE